MPEALIERFTQTVRLFEHLSGKLLGKPQTNDRTDRLKCTTLSAISNNYESKLRLLATLLEVRL